MASSESNVPRRSFAADERRVLSASARVDRPLGGYAALLGVFWVGALGLARARQARDSQNRSERHSERIDWSEFALFALATHRVTMTLATDRVTTVLRAPFIHSEQANGDGHFEEVREGRGLKRAVGQLVTCPFCLGPWVAGLFLTGRTFAPQATRTLATLFAINAASNFTHRVYGRLGG